MLQVSWKQIVTIDAEQDKVSAFKQQNSCAQSCKKRGQTSAIMRTNNNFDDSSMLGTK